MYADAPTVLVVTGSAATGKSTAGMHLRSNQGMLVLGDVLGSGAAAVAGRSATTRFWRYVLAICDEVRGNGLVPLIPCICLPAQVLGAATSGARTSWRSSASPRPIRTRIAARVGVSPVPSPETHVAFDSRREASVPAPHLDPARRLAARRGDDLLRRDQVGAASQAAPGTIRWLNGERVETEATKPLSSSVEHGLAVGGQV